MPWRKRTLKGHYNSCYLSFSVFLKIFQFCTVIFSINFLALFVPFADISYNLYNEDQLFQHCQRRGSGSWSSILWWRDLIAFYSCCNKSWKDEWAFVFFFPSLVTDNNGHWLWLGSCRLDFSEVFYWQNSSELETFTWKVYAIHILVDFQAQQSVLWSEVLAVESWI